MRDEAVVVCGVAGEGELVVGVLRALLMDDLIGTPVLEVRLV